jgi:hypothetical protein
MFGVYWVSCVPSVVARRIERSGLVSLFERGKCFLYGSSHPHLSDNRFGFGFLTNRAQPFQGASYLTIELLLAC